LALAGLGLLAAGCRQDMHDQPKLEPLEASTVFGNGAGSRPMVEGTVARGQLRNDEPFYTGRTSDDEFVTELPLEIDQELLGRGQSRFNAYCSPCHGRVGDGDGMVVQRGFKHPKSFHELRLRESPVGYFFHVITNGFGEMSSYAAQIPPRDRWAVVAYIRALQLSQNVPVEQLGAEALAKIESRDETATESPAEAH
jgi:mono/diheme cytochrome c family protein